MKTEIKKEYYNNGNVRSETLYVNGKIGVKKYYFENGDVMLEIPYKNGKRSGLSKRYYPNGNISLIFNIYQNNWFGIDLVFIIFLL